MVQAAEAQRQQAQSLYGAALACLHHAGCGRSWLLGDAVADTFATLQAATIR